MTIFLVVQVANAMELHAKSNHIAQILVLLALQAVTVKYAQPKQLILVVIMVSRAQKTVTVKVVFV